jgi:hypothetical protein
MRRAQCGAKGKREVLPINDSNEIGGFQRSDGLFHSDLQTPRTAEAAERYD